MQRMSTVWDKVKERLTQSWRRVCILTLRLYYEQKYLHVGRGLLYIIRQWMNFNAHMCTHHLCYHTHFVQLSHTNVTITCGITYTLNKWVWYLTMPIKWPTTFDYIYPILHFPPKLGESSDHNPRPQDLSKLLIRTKCFGKKYPLFVNWPIYVGVQVSDELGSLLLNIALPIKDWWIKWP